MAAPVRQWLDPCEWTEEERTHFWLHARMFEACLDESVATELCAAGADYREVAKAAEGGATPAQLRRIFT